jgi:Predicted membrane protein
MNKLLLAALILSLSALAYLGYKQYEDDDYGSRPAIADSANHNNLMNECVKLALEKHPGAILETEVEMEEGQLITDVDIQGDDGKKWEVECVLASKELIEDKQEN